VQDFGVWHNVLVSQVESGWSVPSSQIGTSFWREERVPWGVARALATMTAMAARVKFVKRMVEFEVGSERVVGWERLLRSDGADDTD
jgi:hypothetical protein